MKTRRLSFRSIFALVIIFGMASACWIGPFFFRNRGRNDAEHGALLPPGSRLLHLVLTSGEEISTASWSETAGVLHVGDGTAARLIPEKNIRSRNTFRAILGTDRFGRDLLLLMLQGGRISLAIALSACFLALLAGLAIGLAAGTGPPILDSILMRGVDAMLAFPPLLLLILAVSLFDPGPQSLVLLLGLSSWMGLSRLVRGESLSLRRREYILAARLSGTSWYRILWRHYLPALRGPVAQDTALRIGDLILAEATLSYLGLGLPATMPTWGRLVQEGHRVLQQAWWLSVFPGIAITLLVIAFGLLGDTLWEGSTMHGIGKTGARASDTRDMPRA